MVEEAHVLNLNRSTSSEIGFKAWLGAQLANYCFMQ